MEPLMPGRQGLRDARLFPPHRRRACVRLLPHRQLPRGGSLIPLSNPVLETVKLGEFGVSYQDSFLQAQESSLSSPPCNVLPMILPVTDNLLRSDP